jgi:hypothetical protein
VAERGDAAHRLLIATGLPPGLAARGRESDAAHQLPTVPGSRLGHGKYVVNSWKTKFFRSAVLRADPVLRLRFRTECWSGLYDIIVYHCILRWLRIHLRGSVFRKNNF